MADSILITGGTGKTGSRIARELRQRGLQPHVASRISGQGDVRFDWGDASTYEAAAAGVRSIYLIAPAGVAEPLDAMRPFLEHALTAGAERFVLLSSSSLEEGGPMLGQVHRFLKERAPAWTVLRPTWFMQNFSELQHLPTIRNEGAIYSATGDGYVPFIDVGDIAAVAVEALVQRSFPSRELILTGPKLLSYDDVARMITAVAGYPVTHRKLTEAELAQRYVSGGMPPQYANILAWLDAGIADGSENRLTDEVRQVTGQQPLAFKSFAERVAFVWRRD